MQNKHLHKHYVVTRGEDETMAQINKLKEQGEDTYRFIQGAETPMA